MNGTATFALAFTKFMSANERAHMFRPKNRATLWRKTTESLQKQCLLLLKITYRMKLFSRAYPTRLDKLMRRSSFVVAPLIDS